MHIRSITNEVTTDNICIYLDCIWTVFYYLKWSLVSHMCLTGAVVASWSLTQELAGW